MASKLAGGAPGFDPALVEELAALGRQLAPRLARLDADFHRQAGARKYGALEIRALAAIAPGAALRFFAAGRPAADFVEEVAYQGRRLAKLNLPPQEVLAALDGYSLPDTALFQPALAQLRLGVALALNTAFYQVREAETQAFYGLFRAETEARGLDELLRRSIEILTRTLRAQAGRLLLVEGAGLAPGLLRRLAAPRYVAAGTSAEALILDPDFRGRHASYWSIPFREGDTVAALAQFGFSTAYRWLPRELTLLEAAAERCLAAVRRARLVRDLSAREEQVRQLAGHLLHAGEDERRRIGRELHDEAGQSMLLLRLELERLEKDAPGALREKLRQARELAERSIAEVRRAIAALSPAVLERLGLEAALRQLTARFEKRCAARVAFRIGLLPELSDGLRMVLYRVAQESYQNIARHAGASRVKLSLTSADGWLELSIADNGAGFDVDAAFRKPDSFGLAGMRERVALAGGVLEAHSRPGRGSRITARIPLPGAVPQKACEHGENSCTPDR